MSNIFYHQTLFPLSSSFGLCCSYAKIRGREKARDNSRSCYRWAVEKQFSPSLYFQNLSNHLQSAHILYNTIAYQGRQRQLLVAYHGRHCSCVSQFAQIVPDWYLSFRYNSGTRTLSISGLCRSPQMTPEFLSDPVSLP